MPRRRWSVKDDTCGYSDRSEENGKEHQQYHGPYNRTGNQKTLVRIFPGGRLGFFRKWCFVRCHYHLHAFTVFRARRGPGQEASRQANPSRCGRQTQTFRSYPAIPLKPDVLSGRVMGAGARQMWAVAGKASIATRTAVVHFNAVMAGWYTACS